MFIAGQKEMQQMDQYTMEKIGLPGVVLMENAGTRVVEEILEISPRNHSRIIILAGGGNNGGDGFVIARRLFDLGVKPPAKRLPLMRMPFIYYGTNWNYFVNIGGMLF